MIIEQPWDSYYLDVLQSLQAELQQIMQSSESELTLLVESEMMKNITITQLKELLDDVLEQKDWALKNRIFSTQLDSEVEREFYIELEWGQQIVDKLLIPFDDTNSFESSHSAKLFFEELVVAVYKARQKFFYAVQGLEMKEQPINILNPNEEEIDYMEKINRLNFKNFLSPIAEANEGVSTEEKSVDTLTESVDLLTTEHAELQFEEMSTDFSETFEEISEDFLQVEEADDFLTEDLDEVLEVDEYVAFDFEPVNQQLNAVFKGVAADSREILKEVKATIWELELKQEEEQLDESDYRYLVQNILSVESDEAAILKFQVDVVRTILNR